MTREESDIDLAAAYHSGGSLVLRDLFAEVRANERERIAEELDLIGATFEAEKPDTSWPGAMIVEYNNAADFVRRLGK